MKQWTSRNGQTVTQYEIDDILPCLCHSKQVIPIVDCRLMVIVVECQRCGQRSSERQYLPAAINNWNNWIRRE